MAPFSASATLNRGCGALASNDSLDYGIVLSGELDMQLDEGEVHLKTGDIVIQREPSITG